MIIPNKHSGYQTGIRLYHAGGGPAGAVENAGGGGLFGGPASDTTYQPKYNNMATTNPMGVSQYGQQQPFGGGYGGMGGGYGGMGGGYGGMGGGYGGMGGGYGQQQQQQYNPFSGGYGQQQYQQQYQPQYQQQYQPQYQQQYQPQYQQQMQPAVQRTSSGPTQPIVSRSAGMRGTPNVMRRAEGGITSLMGE